MLAAEAAILSLGMGAASALAAVPVAAWVARRTGFLDRPVGHKKHGSPTPYLGGTAVVLAFFVAAAAFGGGTDRFLPLALGATGLWAIGTIDDRVNLSAAWRIGATVVVGFALWAADLGWNVFSVPGLDLALTVVWVLGLVNAFNLMDNLDGAAASVAAAASVGIGTFAALNDDAALAAMSFGLVGACLGFLRFNLARPARIFLGDGGSMPIGFLVAALAIAAPPVPKLQVTAVLAAALLVGLVILDTTLVVISRRRRGVSLMTGGRDHLTHRLLVIAKSPRRVAGILAAAQLGLCALALAGADQGQAALFWISAVAVVAGVATIVRLEGLMDRPQRDRPPAPAGQAPAGQAAVSRGALDEPATAIGDGSSRRGQRSMS
ncbi:MAG: undecaprenyl/decaprenyl-phosphate alpha-N-acetylglucosaminyl 1-phosphate transferase [Chloroflexota bacterium]|nr:undecaprenyl/decaprenyl-phosphate alpha-N-acetylglucosaminyl 1-phosphate transferase [Chloroflexota bacterium]